ncbi:MAG: DUF2141 domain-containing protein [Calditrichaeota bacterium]|nr:DUF2141 domain-containing protein [Calditrichota bacterium]MCB9365755.1 DUF2141 domain-containing protein [Calditrichota bacterium]
MRIGLLLLLLSARLFAQDGTTLTVSISGLDSDKGQFIVSVWPGEDSWKNKEPLGRFPVPIVNGGATWTRDGLAAGPYAVTVYHDKNSNAKMDRHWYGPPKEKGAASNGAKAQTFGPPKWEDMMFELGAEPKTIDIKFE